MSDDPPKLDYATPNTGGRRISILAIAALIVAILVNPFSLRSVFGGRGGSPILIILLMALSPSLAIIATVRTAVSRKSLRGLPIAIIALVISLGWLGALALIVMAYARMGA